MNFDNFDWLSQFYSEWRQTSKLVNLKISDKVWVCDFGQNLKMIKTSYFCSIHQENTCKSSLHLNFENFELLSQLYSEWRQTSKSVNLKISDKVWVCDFGQNLKMTKTSYFCSIHQTNTCKSSLHSNLIILTDFHSFTVNAEKFRN